VSVRAAVARIVTFGWPTLLLAAACVGLAAANWWRPGAALPAAAAAAGVAGACALDGERLRLAAAALVLAAAGLWWGGARLDALERSVLVPRLGETAAALVGVTGPARHAGPVIRLPAEVRRFDGVALREPVLLELPAEDGRSPPPQGALLELQARPVAPRGPETGFDERGWLARRGVHVVLRGREARIVGRRGGIGGVADRLRRHVSSALALGAAGERLDLLDGVVLGDDDGLDPSLRDDFRASGLYHLLAVSGQNVAFLAWGVLGLAWLVGIPRVAGHVLALAAIGGYALAVGWQPSVVRAAVAGALASVAWLASRPQERWHFLVLGGLVLLVWNPSTVFDPGFQLSFAAVAAIFLWVPALERRLEELPLPFALPRPLRVAVAVSVACGAVTSPILWADFRQVPVWTVVANALAEPAVGLLLGLALAAALVAPVVPSAAAALAWLAGWPAAWLAVCARSVARLPGAQTSSLVPLAGVAAAAGLALLLGRLPRYRRPAALAVAATALAVGVATRWALARPPGYVAPVGLRVTFLDVGQGDAELLEVPEGAVLVDAGPPEARVGDQLRRLGVRSLSAVVITHPHLDHVGGAAHVVERLRVGRVLDPLQPGVWPAERELRREAGERGVPVVAAREGQSFRLGRLVIRVLWPDGGGLAGENPHHHGVVLLASFGAVDLLLPGDAESEVTAPLPLRAVEVLKVAHHGSADPGLAAELGRLRPRFAVIEVGAGNVYGLPSAATVASLRASPGLRLYRTDRDGRVVLETDGHSIAVRTERGVGSGL
jgi:competence protein ComEC